MMQGRERDPSHPPPLAEASEGLQLVTGRLGPCGEMSQDRARVRDEDRSDLHGGPSARNAPASDDFLDASFYRCIREIVDTREQLADRTNDGLRYFFSDTPSQPFRRPHVEAMFPR